MVDALGTLCSNAAISDEIQLTLEQLGALKQHMLRAHVQARVWGWIKCINKNCWTLLEMATTWTAMANSSQRLLMSHQHLMPLLRWSDVSAKKLLVKSLLMQVKGVAMYRLMCSGSFSHILVSYILYASCDSILHIIAFSFCIFSNLFTVVFCGSHSDNFYLFFIGFATSI